MRKIIVTAGLAFTFALTGLAGVVHEASAVIVDEQANCVGETSSTTATTNGSVEGDVINELAPSASSDCGDGGPEPPKKREPIETA